MTPIASIDNQMPHSLQSWLLRLPAESLERLRQINTSTGSPRHIILALAFGICDEHVRRINRMITSLMISRLKAQREGKHLVVRRIDSFLKTMHFCIDKATGTSSPRQNRDLACSRVRRSQA